MFIQGYPSSFRQCINNTVHSPDGLNKSTWNLLHWFLKLIEKIACGCVQGICQVVSNEIPSSNQLWSMFCILYHTAAICILVKHYANHNYWCHLQFMAMTVKINIDQIQLNFPTSFSHTLVSYQRTWKIKLNQINFPKKLTKIGFPILMVRNLWECVPVAVRRPDSIFCIIKGENRCVTGPYETICKFHP